MSAHICHGDWWDCEDCIEGRIDAGLPVDHPSMSPVKEGSSS